MLIFECDICHKQEKYDKNNYLHKTFRKLTSTSLCEQCFQDLTVESYLRIARLIQKGNNKFGDNTFTLLEELIRYENNANPNLENRQEKIKEIFNELPKKNIHAEIEKTISAIENIFNEPEDEKLKQIIQLTKPKYTDEEIEQFMNVNAIANFTCSIKECQEEFSETYYCQFDEFYLCKKHRRLFDQQLKENADYQYLTDKVQQFHDNLYLDFIFKSYQDENIDFDAQIPF